MEVINFVLTAFRSATASRSLHAKKGDLTCTQRHGYCFSFGVFCNIAKRRTEQISNVNQTMMTIRCHQYHHANKTVYHEVALHYIHVYVNRVILNNQQNKGTCYTDLWLCKAMNHFFATAVSTKYFFKIWRYLFSFFQKYTRIK